MSEKIISTNILSVEIEDIPFYSSNGIETSKRAIINLNLPMKVENRVLGFIDNNEIYKKIQSGENIVLDECFVFNFDFNVSGLKKEELIKINNLSAKNSVFYNAGKFDCTNVHFWGEEVNFDSSIFICEEMLFNMAKFESSFFIMTNCLFNIKKHYCPR